MSEYVPRTESTSQPFDPEPARFAVPEFVLENGPDVSVQVIGKSAINPEWGDLSEQFSVRLHGRQIRVHVYSKRVTRKGTEWVLFTSVDADTNEVLNAEVSSL